MSIEAVFFAGGGTGGHIYPALAVAEKIAKLSAGTRIHFFCSKRQIDSSILGKTNFEFTALPATGFSANPTGAVNFLKNFYGSYKIARRKIAEADGAVVVAVGGFVAGPVGYAAKKLGVPLKLINVDIVPGKANKLLSRWAGEAFLQYGETEGFFNKKGVKTEITGCPLRGEFDGGCGGDIREELGLDKDKKILFITGASSGATNINSAVCANLENISRFADEWQIVHLTGTANYDNVATKYQQAKIQNKVLGYSDDMGRLLKEADLVVGRSGAVSVAEFEAAGAVVICMPYPYHKDRHQYLNAAKLVEAGAAVVVDDVADEKDRTDRLWDPLSELMSDSGKLGQMKKCAEKLTGKNAAMKIAEKILSM
ncbi:MAG TPA: UDP-N-acetylglucosamine--N-acetylmuramyl-(pentapeptide) pyrophosphoryl-undecaprenol N-acetylglucosamine transferase [Sedimentisphaerales bacterium]|nr:UDP-N-acetylglucosamine--N-acetylmuramyl-(pentapeptide) pyrophosphoryl-undecaprenol N-acetylglucosamine transferase [Sedimentisphaerales bacterium]